MLALRISPGCSRPCWYGHLESYWRLPCKAVAQPIPKVNELMHHVNCTAATLYCCRPAHCLTVLRHAVLLMVPQEGPPVIAMRPSLDNRLLALQRSPALLELVYLASGLCFVHSTHQGRGEILSFFFTETPDTDFVVVTTRAVELNQFAAK